jgi:hypothetical protein
MLLIYQAICGGLALLIGAVMLRPADRSDGPAGSQQARRPFLGAWAADGRLGLRVTGAMVLVPLLLRLFLVK